jgi:hypothetical protein
MKPMQQEYKIKINRGMGIGIIIYYGPHHQPDSESKKRQSSQYLRRFLRKNSIRELWYFQFDQKESR